MLALLKQDGLYRVPPLCESKSTVRGERIRSRADALELFFNREFYEFLGEMMERNRVDRNDQHGRPDKFWTPKVKPSEVRLFIGNLDCLIFLKLRVHFCRYQCPECGGLLCQ